MVGCGEMIGIGRWRPVTERGMRPRRVVVSDPSSDDLASLIEIEEQALVEKFVAHAAVEGFDVAILHRLAGRDVVPFHVMLFAPAQDSIRGELGTVIGHDHPRLATPLDDCDELAGNPSARDRGVGDRCQAFSRHVIDDVENTEAPAAGELIVDEVERPARVWLGLDENGRAATHCLAATSAFAHSQSLLAIEPVDAVEPGWLALVAQQDEEPTIAEHLAIGGNDRTGPPLAHLQHATQMSDSLSLGGGPYHFFDSSSFKAALSSIDSAKSFFSLRFSSSRARSRLVSDTSRPPYLAFQLYSVASEIPCLRARSAVFAPASCSRRTAMICSSVNLTRFIVRPSSRAGL